MSGPDCVSIAAPAAGHRALAADIDAALQRVLAPGRYVPGPEGAAPERAIADHVGAAHPVGIASGGDALDTSGVNLPCASSGLRRCAQVSRMARHVS